MKCKNDNNPMIVLTTDEFMVVWQCPECGALCIDSNEIINTMEWYKPDNE